VKKLVRFATDFFNQTFKTNKNLKKINEQLPEHEEKLSRSFHPVQQCP